jgi:hypothetical protein
MFLFLIAFYSMCRMMDRGCYRFDRHWHREKIEEETMKKLHLLKFFLSVTLMLLLWMPAVLQAQPAGPPSVGAPLVREGDFAVPLSSALGLGKTEDEAEAESWLGAAGIAPRNGWIADYPVTPDVLGELQTSVGYAADAKRISMGRDDARKQLVTVCTRFGLSVTPYNGTTTYLAQPPSCENYPNPVIINKYYSSEGPPVVTYYCPPPNYYYLYAWVPFPFWWTGFWFPGFFILHDFHRHLFVHGRVLFVSNHFNDIRVHRIFRVDPVSRFNGKTFAGIGAPRTGNFISTGVPRSDRVIFNAPRGRMMSPPAHGGATVRPPAGGGHMDGTPSHGGGTGGQGR